MNAIIVALALFVAASFVLIASMRRQSEEEDRLVRIPVERDRDISA